MSSRLRSSGPKLKPKKVLALGQGILPLAEVKFLGHVISVAGIQVDMEKVKVLENWPTPTNVTEVLPVVGFMSYSRCFVPNFAHLANPLHVLVGETSREGLHKGAPLPGPKNVKMCLTA